MILRPKQIDSKEATLTSASSSLKYFAGLSPSITYDSQFSSCVLINFKNSVPKPNLSGAEIKKQ